MKKKFICSGVFGVLFLGMIALIKTFDVAKIGPLDTEIGFSALNNAVHEFFGVDMIFYKITQILALVPIVAGGIFALVGLLQLIKRKNLFKVDAEILSLGIVFVILMSLYALFEKVIINYRPIIMPDCNGVEASFPSSHTMLVIVVIVSVMLILNKYIENTALRISIQIIGSLVVLTMVIGRLICGVHWFTDILSGIIVSICLIFLFSGLKDAIKNAQEKTNS